MFYGKDQLGEMSPSGRPSPGVERLTPKHNNLRRAPRSKNKGFGNALKVTPVGFEPTPFRNGALNHRLRLIGQSVAVKNAVVVWIPLARGVNIIRDCPFG